MEGRDKRAPKGRQGHLLCAWGQTSWGDRQDALDTRVMVSLKGN